MMQMMQGMLMMQLLQTLMMQMIQGDVDGVDVDDSDESDLDDDNEKRTKLGEQKLKAAEIRWENKFAGGFGEKNTSNNENTPPPFSSSCHLLLLLPTTAIRVETATAHQETAKTSFPYQTRPLVVCLPLLMPMCSPQMMC